MSKDYGSWSIADLKNELRKRNAKVTGKKAVLVQRLEDYDKLFGTLVTNPESVYKINVPSPQTFRDVTSNTAMPLLNEEDLEIFCQITERENVTTSRNMYQEYFLKSCRLAVADSEYYVTGMVGSEMRKHVIYNVTIKLKNHIILEAQCECAAGMGPYAQCKHILVIILAIIDLNQNNQIKLKTSITSNLQTFHQPNKMHTGDPLKAEDLTLKFKDKNYEVMTKFDPRPVGTSVENYSYYFKNLISNFCFQNEVSKTIPMTQLIKPADKTSIFKEHDYLKNTDEEEFLQSLILTEEGICRLEEKTRNNKKLWKRERLMRIQSSTYGRICKCRGDEKKLASSLVKNVDVVSAAIKHGYKYEDDAVRQFEIKSNFTTKKCGLIVHKEFQFLASTPDRLVGENCVLEVKCPYTARHQTISPENVPYLYLCEKTGLLKLHVMHDYYYQIQGQLVCTGREMAFFCVYTISDIKILIIKRNNTFINIMFNKLKHFYEEFFKDIFLNKFLYNKKF